MPQRRKYMPVNNAAKRHGEKLQKARLALGLTQTEVGKIFNMGRQVISKLECGYYDITRAYPRLKLKNEKMRIWAEMNMKTAPPLKPYVNQRSEFWKRVTKENNERKNTERSLIGSGDQGDHSAGNRQAS